MCRQSQGKSNLGMHSFLNNEVVCCYYYFGELTSFDAGNKSSQYSSPVHCLYAPLICGMTACIGVTISR